MSWLRSLPAARATWERDTDVIVIGSGAAGMSAALEAAQLGRRVLLVSKDQLGGGSTPLAQGGLAAVLGPDDSAELHRQDTLVAGAGLCDPEAVSSLVTAAAAEIAWLTDLGARFDDGPLGLEGGHSRRRVVHAGGDASGAEVHRTLVEALLASPVEVLDHTVALDALLDEAGHVCGVTAGRRHEAAGQLRVGILRAGAVVLAAGGYGQAFATTTNPLGVTGDGVALAARAGAEISDVEFVQFHPTVLWQAGGRGQQPLVTEALRGAGATLVDSHGRRVMAGEHPLGDLAPRDVVAEAMHRRMAAGDGPSTHLWLDATSVGRSELASHFPNLVANCRARGIDPATTPIPVAPGAHYACGGVRATMSGETSLAGLYAVGEVAATGLHGANRLASNSVTEAIAAGRRVGQLLGTSAPVAPAGTSAAAGTSAPAAQAPALMGAGSAAAHRGVLADAMSRYAGVSRSVSGLEQLLEILAAAPPAGAGPLDLATVEATNLHAVSSLVATAALARTESRGCHRRSDWPEPRPEWAQRLTLRAGADGAIEARVGVSA